MDCRTQLASLAIEELDKGDFLMATKILTTGIKLEPNNHELYFERSICHHKLGNFRASLDDADAAIRLNSSDYNIYYQRGLALIGLSMFSDAVTSFKKAIELRAKQDDSKLSDIFKLLRDATNELNSARRKPGANPTTHLARVGESSAQVLSNQASLSTTTTTTTTVKGGGNEPVDSTTDRPVIKSSSDNSQLISPINGMIKSSNSNLVATHRNNMVNNNSNNNSTNIMNNNLKTNGGNNQSANISAVLNGAISLSRVSSTASHFDNSNNDHINVSSDISNLNTSTTSHVTLVNTNNQQLLDQPKPGSFEWNIRRSERIFLHNTNEPSTSGANHYVVMPRQNPTFKQHQKATSNSAASVSSGKSGTKHLNDIHESHQHNKQMNVANKSNSHVESDIDVDDSYNHQTTLSMNGSNELNANGKRIMVAPSSSMPATSHSPGTTTATPLTKDDSYSSKWKRLRRDRERARRGTSKLCTIKLSDLEELQRPSSKSSGKRTMRVIAPIDGWLYSGELSVDENYCNDGEPQYVVKLDGDSTGSSYLFTSQTVLNDVIKEVRVKTVSELRKGARICCYWSRQYKCLSTGVVTSRTFEATKSLVSVKYDNGDLSALPLEDLRLLPPDYPKYMSNCDPLLLARNSDGANDYSEPIAQNDNNIAATDTKDNEQLVVNDQSSIGNQAYEASKVDDMGAQEQVNIVYNHVDGAVDIHQSERSADHRIELDDVSSEIPATNETIDFITNGDVGTVETNDPQKRVTIKKSTMTLASDSQMLVMDSRASSEENNYGIEYKPWTFEGVPKRSKRHGRTYRDNYMSIRRGSEVIKIGDSAELMPRDESILPFIAKVDGLWATSRGEMRVRVRWYYRLVETEGEPLELLDGANALFETDHFDENDVQSIYRSTKILSWTDYRKDHLGHVNKHGDSRPKIFYLAGYYDPVRRVKHLRSDVKEAQ